MKLKDARDAYYFYSGKASDVSRQLALAGIALVWIFKVGDATVLTIPADLMRPALAFVLTLLLDILQYGIGALIWGGFARQRERDSVGDDAEFLAPRQLNWPTVTLFWAKLILISVGYALMFQYLLSVLRTLPLRH